MRLLFWSELFRPEIGGVEVWSLQLIHALQERGHHCIAVACQGPASQSNASEFEGIRVHRFPFHRALINRDLRLMKQLSTRLNELKKRFKPDLIHINSTQPSLLFHERTRSTSACPTVVSLHEPPQPGVTENSLYARLIQQSNWTVGVSHAMLEAACSILPEIQHRSSVIHNALNLPFSETPVVRYTGPPTILCVGRLVPEKGFVYAIQALAKLTRDLPEIKLQICGNGPDRSALEKLTVELNIAHHIEFTGWIAPERIADRIDSADIVLVPSLWNEPFGLVALEAAMRGRPVLASAVGGLKEIVVHNQTGYLVEPGDVEAIANRIRFLIEHPSKRFNMSKAAQLHARQHFDFNEFVEAYVAVYKSVLHSCDTPAEELGI